jgi:hypothetical protein
VKDKLKRRMKLASLISVVLCVVMTIGFVIGGGEFKGPSTVVYFIMLVGCVALAVGLALEDEQ